ncbi:MAG: diguanylate cyclase, partial [Moraxellaceae bacterium]
MKSMSAEMYRIFGVDPTLPPPEFMELAQRIHPDDRETFIWNYHAFMREGTGYQMDFRLPQANGDFLWIEARSETIRDEDGRAIKLIGTAQDITERKKTELALNASESRFRAFMENTPILAFIKDNDGKFVYINPTFERTFDILLEDIIGKTVFDYWPLEVAQKVHAHDAPIYTSNEQVEAYEDVPTKHGMRHWFSVKFGFTNAEGQRFLGATAMDITDNYRAEQALRTSTELLETSQSIAKLGGWELDIATLQVSWTNESYRLHDATPGEFCPTLEGCIGYLIGESRERFVAALDVAMHYGESFDIEVESFTTKGRRIDVRVNCSATLHHGKPIKLTGIFQDISDQKAAQVALETANRELGRTNAVLKHIAHYDPLTHLPNRVLLADRMQQAMIHNQRHGKSLAVAFLDLDGFKSVNDQHGHSVGDTLLITLAQRMRAAMREGDTLARIGGDEFVAVLTDLKEISDCEPLLDRLLKAAAEPVIHGDHILEVSASIGVTIYPQDGVDAEHLLRHADQAMYVAKQAGKNCYHLFDVARDEAVKHQRESLEHIRTALHNNEFVLYYQPKVNMRTGAVIGAEALIRWQHPERGLLPPAAFLPIIEANLISIEVGEWVIDTALKQIAEGNTALL